MNALASELDDILRVLFSNKSWLCYSYTNTGFPEGRRFYFGDPSKRRIITSTDEYKHADFVSSAAAKVVERTDLENHLAFVIEGPAWDLDGSLQAHKKTVTVDGTPYELYLCQQDGGGLVLSRERHRRLHVAEIIIEGWPTGEAFDFSTAWDKYHFVRFHNLDHEARTINLPGGQSIEIPAFGIQAARRSYKIGSTWDTTYRYLWNCQSGDQLIFDAVFFGSRANNVASLRCYHDILDFIIDGVNPYRRGAFIDPSVVWDGASLLPATIADSTRFGELYHHLGDVLSVEAASTTGTSTRGVIASWSALEGAGSQGLVVTVSGDDMQIAKTAARTAPVDAVGFGTTLIPSNPVTLPYTATTPRPALSLPGQQNNTNTLTASYTSGGTPVTITKDFTESSWSIGWALDAGVRAWDTLTDCETLVAGLGGSEVGSVTGQAWKSDGWRLLATGSVVYDLTNAFSIESLYAMPDNATWGLASVSIPFGQDMFLRKFQDDMWMITARRAGRKLSENSGFEAFGTVFYQSHPDLEGGDGLDEGVDWNASRVAPDTSVVYKTEVAGALTETKTLPVIPLMDSADRCAENYATSGWWASNRTSLLAGPSVDDKQRIIRMPILREHYNHVAQRLNAIVSVRPFLFEDVLWYGELADGAWSTWVEAVADYYCPVLSTGSRAAELGLTVYSVFIYRIFPVVNETRYYVKASEVATLAEGMGFTFLLERMETPTFQSGVDDQRVLSSTDFTKPWRQHDTSFVIAKHASLGDDRLWPPAAWTSGATSKTAPVFKHERHIKTISDLPASWSLNTDSKFIVVPRAVINWDNDPVTTDLDFATSLEIPASDEPVSAVDPISTSQVVFGSASVTGETGPEQLATLLGKSLADGREAFDVRLINRLFFKRT